MGQSGPLTELDPGKQKTIEFMKQRTHTFIIPATSGPCWLKCRVPNSLC